MIGLLLITFFLFVVWISNLFTVNSCKVILFHKQLKLDFGNTKLVQLSVQAADRVGLERNSLTLFIILVKDTAK